MRTTKDDIKAIFRMYATIAGMITTVFLIAAIPAALGSGPQLKLTDSVQEFGAMTGNPHMQP